MPIYLLHHARSASALSGLARSRRARMRRLGQDVGSLPLDQSVPFSVQDFSSVAAPGEFQPTAIAAPGSLDESSALNAAAASSGYLPGFAATGPTGVSYTAKPLTSSAAAGGGSPPWFSAKNSALGISNSTIVYGAAAILGLSLLLAARKH